MADETKEVNVEESSEAPQVEAKTTKKAPAKRKYTKKSAAKKVEAPAPEPVVEAAPKKSKKKEVSRFQSRRR